MLFKASMLLSMLVLYCILISCQALYYEQFMNRKGERFCDTYDSAGLAEMCRKLAIEKGITDYNEAKMETFARSCQTLTVFLEYLHWAGGDFVSGPGVRCQYYIGDSAEVYGLIRGVIKSEVTILEPRTGGWWGFVGFSYYLL